MGFGVLILIALFPLFIYSLAFATAPTPTKRGGLQRQETRPPFNPSTRAPPHTTKGWGGRRGPFSGGGARSDPGCQRAPMMERSAVDISPLGALGAGKRAFWQRVSVAG